MPDIFLCTCKKFVNPYFNEFVTEDDGMQFVHCKFFQTTKTFGTNGEALWPIALDRISSL